MIYSALLLYLILFLTVPSVFRFNVWVISILPFAGFGLAIFHRLLKLKNKWIKAFSRFTAGFGIGAYCALMIQTLFIPRWWWIALILAVLLLLGNQMYGISRGPNANRSKCANCPLRIQEPSCNPDRNTNIKVRKIYAIVEEELQKAKDRIKKPVKN